MDPHPQRINRGSTDGPHRINRGATEGPQRMNRGSTGGPQRVNGGSTEGPQSVHRGSAEGPQRVHRGSAEDPQRVRRGSTEGPQGVRRGSTEGPKRAHRDRDLKVTTVLGIRNIDPQKCRQFYKFQSARTRFDDSSRKMQSISLAVPPRKAVSDDSFKESRAVHAVA